MNQISVPKKKEAKELGLNVQELAFADLRAMGWSVPDAYLATLGGAAWDKNYFKNTSAELDNSDGVKRRKEFINAMRSEPSPDGKKRRKSDSDVDIIAETSKEETLRQLVLAKRNTTPGTKEWLDLNKQIIEVTQMKRDQVEEEDTTVHYYLPLKCDKCELYMRKKMESVQ